MPNGQAPYAWTPPTEGEWRLPTEEEKAAQEYSQYQEQLGQAYINWLYNYLYMLQFTDDSMQDPMEEGSDANRLLTEIANRIDRGMSPATMPMFDQFYQSYQLGLPQAGVSPEETAYMESETAYNLARVQEILNSIQASGQVSPDTEAELAYLTQRLEFDMRQAGIGNEQEWAQINIQKQQLQLRRNEWLAELQASPATWIERWQAERMPWGGARIPLESDVQLAQWAGGMGRQAPFRTATQRASASATAALPVAQKRPLQGGARW